MSNTSARDNKGNEPGDVQAEFVIIQHFLSAFWFQLSHFQMKAQTSKTYEPLDTNF